MDKSLDRSQRSGGGFSHKRYVVKYRTEDGLQGVWDREEQKYVGRTQTEAGARIIAARWNRGK